MTASRRGRAVELRLIDDTMKIAMIAALALAAGLSSAWAQDVVITSEHDTVIREYVKEKPLASISVPGVELNIGHPYQKLSRFTPSKTSQT